MNNHVHIPPYFFETKYGVLYIRSMGLAVNSWASLCIRVDLHLCTSKINPPTTLFLHLFNKTHIKIIEKAPFFNEMWYYVSFKWINMHIFVMFSTLYRPSRCVGRGKTMFLLYMKWQRCTIYAEMSGTEGTFFVKH